MFAQIWQLSRAGREIKSQKVIPYCRISICFISLCGPADFMIAVYMGRLEAKIQDLTSCNFSLQVSLECLKVVWFFKIFKSIFLLKAANKTELFSVLSMIFGMTLWGWPFPEGPSFPRRNLCLFSSQAAPVIYPPKNSPEEAVGH